MLALISAMGVLSFSDIQTGCGGPEGLEALVREADGRVLLFGETHGTNEMPAIVGAAVCYALAEGGHVALALEMASHEQDRLDAYIASDGSADARANLYDGSSFWSVFRDGRSSVAMLRLIDDAKILRRNGALLDVVAVDQGAQDTDLTGPQPRDQAMARNLTRLREDYEHVILLVGNVHSRRTAILYEDLRLETIGTYMDAETYRSIWMAPGPGTSWGCRRDEDGELDCSVHQRIMDDTQGAPRVLTDAEMDGIERYEFFRDAYDVVIYAGEITAAEPAYDQHVSE